MYYNVTEHFPNRIRYAHAVSRENTKGNSKSERPERRNKTKPTFKVKREQ